jgi:hypothetical protein
MMNKNERQLLAKLGLILTDLELGPEQDRNGEFITTGSFKIDNEVFRSMCYLIRLTEMIANTKNPACNKMFEQLVTMLELTRKEEG